MTEFDEYLQLGNELEQENNILMAYAAYYEAIKRGTGEQKQIIENYLKMLIEKRTKDKSERNQQLKSQLLKWIEEEKISYAISCFSNILNENNKNNNTNDNGCHKIYVYRKLFPFLNLLLFL